MSKYKNTVHKNPFREDRPKKPIPWMAIAIALLSVVVAILLIVFLTSYFGVVHLTTETAGELHDSKNNITYRLADMNYSADLYMEEPYAECGDTKYYKLYYKDKNGKEAFCDPLKMIGTKDEFGIIELYCAEGFELPSLFDMGVTKALVSAYEMIDYAIDVMDGVETELAVRMLRDNEKLPYPTDVNGDTVLAVYFGGSEAYPYLQYVIRFFETESGGRYLYDRVTGACVSIGEELKDAL